MAGFYYINIANGLLEPRHVEAMGEAVWLYMWLLDKNTSINENGLGKVLGNKPVVFDVDVKPVLGIHRTTYFRWVEKLRSAGYIQTLRTPHGLVITITKAKKNLKSSRKSEHHKNSEVAQMNSEVANPHTEVAKTNMQYKTNKRLNNTNKTITNVIDEPEVRYGNADVNEIFDFWEQTMGYPIKSKVKPNRNAASGLVKAHGMEATKRFVTWVSIAHGEKYVRSDVKAADFIELRANLNKIYAWARGKAKDERSEVPSF